MKRRTRCLVAGVLGAALASTADAQPPAPMQSVNFFAHGPCNGQDDVASNQYPPWQEAPVMIVGVDLVVYFSGAAAMLEYAFAGNSVTPDVMGWIGPGESHSSSRMPANLGMLFGPGPGGPHVDMHVNCIGLGVAGVTYQGFETIYYTAAQ